MAAKILVVDDELPIVQVLAYNLKQNGYQVCLAHDGEAALAQARQHLPDLIVLDLMLPKLDGLDVCRILRRERDVPIIMLTARDDEIDRVLGLELGADDYVVKPFSVRELIVRIKNILRRLHPAEDAAHEGMVRVGALTIDTVRHSVLVGDRPLELTLLEFTLLHTMARHAGQVLSREQLIEQIWGYDWDGDGRVVDAVVKRLRGKLRQASPEDLIVTVRGLGYKLQDDH
jgi:DNA-binding response OmpR family regulator